MNQINAVCLDCGEALLAFEQCPKCVSVQPKTLNYNAPIPEYQDIIISLSLVKTNREAQLQRIGNLQNMGFTVLVT